MGKTLFKQFYIDSIINLIIVNNYFKTVLFLASCFVTNAHTKREVRKEKLIIITIVSRSLSLLIGAKGFLMIRLNWKLEKVWARLPLQECRQKEFRWQHRIVES